MRVITALPGGANPAEGYTRPSFVMDGSVVFFPHPTPEKPRAAARCKVLVTAGMHARIVNETYGIDRWVSLYDLIVPVGDPLAPT